MKDCCVACSQPYSYLAVPACIYSFWHGVIPTSYSLYILYLGRVLRARLSMHVRALGEITHVRSQQSSATPPYI